MLEFLHIGGQYLFEIALVAGGAYLVLFTPLGVPALRNVGLLLLAASVVFGAFLLGEYEGREECASAVLRAQVAKGERELKITNDSEVGAQKVDDQLQQQAEDANKKDASFEKHIAARAACALSADDLAGLRSIR